jgi:hypothetical protein
MLNVYFAFVLAFLPTPGSTYTRAVCNAPPTQWTEHVVQNGIDGADGVEIAPSPVGGNTLCGVTPWEQGTTVSVWCLNGWTPTTVILDSSLSAAEGAGWGDFDDDGLVDVCAVSQSASTSNVKIYFQPVSGWDTPSNWDTEVITNATNLGNGYMQCKGFDMNADTKDDLLLGGITATNPGQIVVMPQGNSPRTGSDWAYNAIHITGRVMAIHARDFNADGDMDIVATDREAVTGGTPGVFVLWGDGTTAFSYTRQNIMIGNGSPRMMFELGDLDDNGESFDFCSGVDSTTWGTRCFVHYSIASIHVWMPTLLPEPPDVGVFQSCEIVDVDLDQYDDLVCSFSASTPSTDTVNLWLKGGPTWPRWQKMSIDTEGTKSDNIKCRYPNGNIIDPDGDGDPDCIDTEQDTGGSGTGLGVRILENSCR